MMNTTCVIFSIPLAGAPILATPIGRWLAFLATRRRPVVPTTRQETRNNPAIAAHRNARLLSMCMLPFRRWRRDSIQEQAAVGELVTFGVSYSNRSVTGNLRDVL